MCPDLSEHCIDVLMSQNNLPCESSGDYQLTHCNGDPAKRYEFISRSTLGPFKGAYAKKPLHQGQIIAKYTGNYDSDADNTHYVYYNEATGMARDAWDHTKGEVTCLAGYINDPLIKEGGNCKFVEKGCHLAVETMQDIPEGEELLLQYEKDYWLKNTSPRAIMLQAQEAYQR
eukprot:gene13296-biopygen6569